MSFQHSWHSTWQLAVTLAEAMNRKNSKLEAAMERKNSRNNEEQERKESQPFRFSIRIGAITTFDPGHRQQERLRTTHDQNLFCLTVFVCVYFNQDYIAMKHSRIK